MAYDIEYKFGFILPVTVTVPALRPEEETVTLCLGELEDCEAVACINRDELGEWYIEEFHITKLPGVTASGKEIEGTLRLDAKNPDPAHKWIVDAIWRDWNTFQHRFEVDRQMAEEFPSDEPSWEQNERAIYHQSVL